MSAVRYEPWNMFDQLRREMERMYDRRGDQNDATTASDWVPAVDVREEKDKFVILADVPGIDAKEIEIHAEHGVLSIKGERKPEGPEEQETFKRVERPRGTFFRRFNLPDTADTDRIAARCRNGVLEVTIPKHERHQPRKISVEG